MSMVPKDKKFTQPGTTISSTTGWNNTTTPRSHICRYLEGPGDVACQCRGTSPSLGGIHMLPTRRSFRESKTTFIDEKEAVVLSRPVSPSP